MSNPANLVLVSTSLLRLVSILVGLWLASRFEPRIASLLQGDGTRPPGPVPRTLLWLALGSIFAIPLFDLIGLLQMLVELIAPASWGLADGSVATFWGSAPPRLFDALSGGTTLAVYAGAYSLLWRHLRDRFSPILSALARSTADRILLSLASAGLINLMVTTIVVSVVFVQLRTAARPPAAGTAGFVIAWLIGLLLVLALALWMQLRVQANGAEG